MVSSWTFRTISNLTACLFWMPYHILRTWTSIATCSRPSFHLSVSPCDPETFCSSDSALSLR